MSRKTVIIFLCILIILFLASAFNLVMAAILGGRSNFTIGAALLVTVALLNWYFIHQIRKGSSSAAEGPKMQ